MFPVINIGPLSVPAPAFILIIGYLAGSYLLDKKASIFSIDSDLLDRALWIGTVSTLLGARISYIVGSPIAFKGDLLSIISLNPALLDPVGGLLIGASAVYLVIAKQDADGWAFLDSLTLFLGPLIAAYFLSRYSSGDGYGIVTDLPWGIELWGAIRHPVQLYQAASALIVVVIVLIYSPSKNLLSGNIFLLFSVSTFSYLLFFAHFQEPGLLMISGFRIEQIVYWLLLLAGLLFMNFRSVSSPTKE